MKGGGEVEKIKLSLCYCHIPLEKLSQLVYLRYIVGMETGELMKEFPSQQDREYLAALALLDVPSESLEKVVQTEDPSLIAHLFGCRERAFKILKEHGINFAKEMGR